jgi:hypothetical protein
MRAPQPSPVWRRAHRRQDRFARAFSGGLRCAALRPVLTAAARSARANPRSGRRNGASIEQRNWLFVPGPKDGPEFNWLT